MPLGGKILNGDPLHVKRLDFDKIFNMLDDGLVKSPLSFNRTKSDGWRIITPYWCMDTSLDADLNPDIWKICIGRSFV